MMETNIISHFVCFVIGTWFGIGIIAVLKASHDD